MAILPKISRAKGVEICADLLYSGQSRKEILQHITEKYKASEKTVDNWLKDARPIVSTRQATAEQIRARVDKEDAEASAKRLNLTREAMLERLGEIIYQGKRIEKPAEVTVAGKLQNEEETESGLLMKASDVIKAVEVVNKMQGYNAPEKSDVTSRNTGPIDFTKYTDEELRLIANLQRKGRVGAQESA